MKNLLTDIVGIRVGHAHDARLATGTTAILFENPAVVSVDTYGGSGEREHALLDLASTVERVDAITLSGGSSFGLDACSGVQAWLAEQNRGFRYHDAVIPIVPGAVLFDLNNGNDNTWGRFPPYRDLGYAAAAAASSECALGSVGAGLGATTANFKGGVGSASAITRGGLVVAALVIVNAMGSVTVGRGPWFWAAPFEVNGEFGGCGQPPEFTQEMFDICIKASSVDAALESTTIGLVATDAVLTRAQAKGLARTAQAGFARALYPIDAMQEGACFFSAATCEKSVDSQADLLEIGAVAANVTARAIARAIYNATALPFDNAQPAWGDRFPRYGTVMV